MLHSSACETSIKRTRIGNLKRWIAELMLANVTFKNK